LFSRRYGRLVFPYFFMDRAGLIHRNSLIFGHEFTQPIKEKFMKKYVWTPGLFLLLFVQFSLAQHTLIPAPVEYEAASSDFVLEGDLHVYGSVSSERVRKHLAFFEKDIAALGRSLVIHEEEVTAGSGLRVALHQPEVAELGEEGYTLIVDGNGMELSANGEAGIFNGLQTLRQLLPSGRQEEDQPVQVSGCRIKDYPRFGWRGLMLDVSRHFFTVEEVKEYLDQMARYKFNVFHWHLTDDEGWRIEIKSFPRLTEVGAWRVERHGRFGSQRPYPKKGEKATYGGFYTQEQIRDVVAYAADRNITILPEIDVPGHSMALLAAYPEFSTKKELKFVNPGSKFANWFGDGKFEMLIENTLNPADEAVYAFLDMVFGEVAGLFPGEYIHMGGDECYHGYWERDPKVQEFMKKNGLEDSHALQSYFVKRMEKIISSKGKKLIGWDEILEGGLAEGAAVMSWRGMDGGIEAAKMGHEVVMTPTTFAYLDYTQGDYSVENEIYADLSLEKSYSFEPVPEGVDPGLILGGQGNLWTEVIPSLSYAYYMTYPRALAIAETLWSPSEKKDWKDFLRRTEVHFTRFDDADISVSKAVYDPIVRVYTQNGKLMCTLENPFEDVEIFYTIDNTYPVEFGNKYAGPFEIPEGDLSLRTRSFRGGEPIGRILRIHRTDLVKRSKGEGNY